VKNYIVTLGQTKKETWRDHADNEQQGIASNEPANCTLSCTELSNFRESSFTITSAAGELAWACDQAPSGCLLMNHAWHTTQSV